MTRIWWILKWDIEILKIFTLIGSFFTQYITLDLKKVQRSYLSRHFRVMQNLKKNWPVVLKMSWGIWQIFTRALESLKIGTLMWSFYPKSKIYELKTYRGVMCHGNVEGYKIWIGIDLSFQNWHEEFDTFWLEHPKILKICTLMGSSWTKYIIFDLKNYRRVRFHHTEEWCKVWRKTDLFSP